MSAALKAALLDVVRRYRPGAPVDTEHDAEVKAAAALLEADAGPPDLVEAPHLVDGVWLCLFDSRDLLHAADMARMTVGALPSQRVPIRTTFQELRPALGFYRNTMVMEAGPERLPFNYISTAQFEIRPEARNVFQVSFTSTSFVPADARVTPEALRTALGMPAAMPLSWTQAPRGPFPSIVTYADEALRLNRGDSYISVLQRLV